MSDTPTSLVRPLIAGIFVSLLCAGAIFYFGQSGLLSYQVEFGSDVDGTSTPAIIRPTLDKELYDELMLRLANYPVPKVATSTATSTAASTHVMTTGAPIVASTASSTSTTTAAKKLWPTQAPYPNFGAVLPFDRIVAYYGNFYSGALGVLGAYPPEIMMQHLMAEVKKWQEADPETRAVPALDYIAVVAQGGPGPDGLYRARMPASEIQKAIDLANSVDGLVILDVQVGKSTLQQEIPLLEGFLRLPNVHLAIDPEFSMKDGKAPGREVGTFDAADVNYAATYLAGLVREYDLPPKVLIIHRFTEEMVTGYKDIQPLPETQILVDMDGYGTPAQKTKVYKLVVSDEPVQFAGLKLFYKNDIANKGAMMTPDDAMALQPRPSFIQYQ